MADILDNPIWHALTGAQSAWALRRGHAVRFVPEAAPFFALDDPGADGLLDLAALVRQTPGAAGLEARLFLTEPIPTPPGWRKTFEKPLAQMLLTDTPRPGAIDEPIVELGPDDDAEILALARRAEPGPFGPRTRELGTFLGIRRQGKLVAMAGERLRLPGFTEISAIATDPAHRARGFGGALTAALAAHIRAAGAMPFLHVFPDNPAAALYRALGFSERRSLIVTWLQLPA